MAMGELFFFAGILTVDVVKRIWQFPTKRTQCALVVMLFFIMGTQWRQVTSLQTRGWGHAKPFVIDDRLVKKHI